MRPHRFDPYTLRMNVSVLIPWRSDNGARERVWQHLLPLWEATGADICIGTDTGEGPFNCSMAQNHAFAQAKYDTLIMFGADQLPHVEAIEHAKRCIESGMSWLPIMHKTSYFSRDDTERILGGADHRLMLTEYTLDFCTGLVALTREAYTEVGGMDERFAGWGYEDAAFRQTLAGMYGAPAPLPYTLQCLWHETDHRITVSPNSVLMNDYIPLTTPEVTREYLTKRGNFV